jgi:uncharacterized membrane protein YjjB (DUF3815 family)
MSTWKTVAVAALGATLGTVVTQTYFSGFNMEVVLASGVASLLGALFFGYVTTLGKRK